MHKGDDTPLRPVLFLPVSAHDSLNKWLTKFDNVARANFETSTEKMKSVLNLTSFEEKETVSSMDVNSLYTNVLVMEAIELAYEALFTPRSPPPLSKPTFRTLMELAVTNVWVMCGSERYIQRDGVAMGAFLAVILANIWLKHFEEIITAEETQPGPLKMQNTLTFPCGKSEECIANSVLNPLP